MKRWLPALILVLFSLSASAQNPDAETIVERSVAANQADWKAAPQFACFDKERIAEGTETFETLMIQGSPYYVLVAVNGQPLSPEDKKEEQVKLRKVIAQRQRESNESRERRIAGYESELKRNRTLLQEMTKAFHFSLRTTQILADREVYVLDATPRRDYHPPNRETEVLKGMQGRMWIDTTEFQWVKVEAEAIRPVSIEGFLARVEPGTRFELEMAPVAPGVWMPKHFSMFTRARILFIFPVKQQEDDTYSGCHLQGALEDEGRLAENWKPGAGDE